MGTRQPSVAFLAGLGFSPFIGIEGMGRVAAVALVLDVMAPIAEGFSKRVRKSLILWMVFYPVPGNGMPALQELVIFFFMALATGLGFNHRYFGPCFFMAFMAGDTIHLVFGMFAIDPGLKDPSRRFLMTLQAIANLLLSPNLHGNDIPPVVWNGTPHIFQERPWPSGQRRPGDQCGRSYNGPHSLHVSIRPMIERVQVSLLGDIGYRIQDRSLHLFSSEDLRT